MKIKINHVQNFTSKLLIITNDMYTPVLLLNNRETLEFTQHDVLIDVLSELLLIKHV